MGTARFDDGTPDNIKLIAAGPTACWLWFCGVIYCRKALTDGFIPRAVVPSLVHGLTQPFRHAARLVECKLWHETDGGYMVHDFLDWNPTKAAMDEYRKADRERKHKKYGIRDTSSPGIRAESEWNPDDGANAHGTHAGAKSKSQSESKSELDLRIYRSKEMTNSPTGLHPRDAGLINGSSIRRHGTHAWCSLPREGLCVPVFLHDEFIGKLGRPDAVQTLRAWYASTVAKFDGVAVGEDSLRFWRNEFAAWVGTVTTAPATAIGRRTAAQTTIATANRG